MKNKIQKSLQLFFAIIILLVLSLTSCSSKNDFRMNKELQVSFNGDAQVEVGGPFVGVEFHHSSPMPQRISFFYPAANSIDLSNDYWKRDSTFIMSAGIRVGYGAKEWIGLTPFKFDLTPYGVTYFKEDQLKTIKISYRFCKDKSTMVVVYEITNNSKESEPFEFYTHLELSLKTCHTYALKSKAWTEFDNNPSTIYANFDDTATQNAQIFVANAGLKPESYNTIGTLKNYPYNNDWWYRSYSALPEKILNKNDQGVPAAEFVYKQNLDPDKTMTVIQLIGSAKQGEGKSLVNYLGNNYEKEINDYEKSVLAKVDDGKFITGDSVLDKSYKWAKAILAVNKHYIDGSIVPMPCPAEYNFYFTHDVLVTDYAAVNFDLPRVKNDLEYIISHASKDFIIPHAYYWKDSAYKTEFASSDNWNNFWFIIVAGSYLRHSNDVNLVNRLYPYLTKCIEQSLLNKKDDDLMWENHLDGSDLGNSYGPRAFMTSLAIKSLREYVFISTVLGKNESNLINHETLADKMQNALSEKLWNDKQEYLLNYYKDGKLDTHYYTGSLIAPHFKLLNHERIDALVNSAIYRLLDPKIGIYSIYPMDLDKLKSFLQLKDDEAGEPFYYANGGIWNNANAWFALDLISDNKKDEALNFIKKTMTLDGIINSPNGQPAMYEYRISDYTNPKVYGKIDKPEFLWAAGWYIYSSYHLFGIDESSWNIVFNPYLMEKQNSCSYSVVVNGEPVDVNIIGKGKFIKSIKYDGKEVPSAVVPSNIAYKKVEITLGEPQIPYLKNTNSILKNCSYDYQKKRMKIELGAFKGHENNTVVVSAMQPKEIYLEGERLDSGWNAKSENSTYIIEITFTHRVNNMNLQINF